MPQSEVIKLLGKPDEIRDRAPVRPWDPDVEWAYGIDRPGGYATLATVIFKKGVVANSSFRWRDKAPIPNLPPEAELRSYLRQMKDGRLKDLEQYDVWDPLHLVRTVNLLLPLEKDQVLAVLQQYERLERFQPGSEWTVPLGALLFPNAPIRSGLVIADDVPFLFNKPFHAGTGLGPPDLLRYIEEGTERWELRRAPLRPADNPFEALQKANAKYAAAPSGWTRAGEEFDAHRDLALALVREVYPGYEEALFEGESESLAFLARTFKERGARWDSKRNRYVKRDGTWTPFKWSKGVENIQRLKASLGFDVNYMLQRFHRDRLDLNIYCGGASRPYFLTWRAFDAKTNEKLGECEGIRVDDSLPLNTSLAVRADSGVRIEITVDGKIDRRTIRL